MCNMAWQVLNLASQRPQKFCLTDYKGYSTIRTKALSQVQHLNFFSDQHIFLNRSFYFFPCGVKNIFNATLTLGNLEIRTFCFFLLFGKILVFKKSTSTFRKLHIVFSSYTKDYGTIALDIIVFVWS